MATGSRADAQPVGSYAAFLDLRDRLLGSLRTKVLSDAELREVATMKYGTLENFSLYGVPATAMTAKGIRLLGRTFGESSNDTDVIPVAEALAEVQAANHAGQHGDEHPFIADLFCGSGNVGHHLGRRLGFRTHATELDPEVYKVTRNNLDRIGSTIELSFRDFRDLLGELTADSPRDTYVVEPPWGPALSTEGLDLDRTSPPVPEILDAIRRSRDGMPCYIVIKTNDRLANDSLTRSFVNARHQRSITPAPYLPYGANMDFHIYLLD